MSAEKNIETAVQELQDAVNEIQASIESGKETGFRLEILKKLKIKLDAILQITETPANTDSSRKTFRV